MPHAAAASFPATTGKTAAAENFPVASWLLPAAIRAQVMAFYRVARMADDIADDPKLGAEEKLLRLEAVESGLRGGHGPAEAAAFRAAMGENEKLLAHAIHLLDAFRRDAVSDHCRDWADLMSYCRFSAAPVGRFLLDLHGEPPETMAAGDALCAAHQILNHLQDCGADFRSLGRVYLPRDWMQAEGLTNEVLSGPHSPDALRRVFDRVLDGVDGLIELARPLPVLIRSRRLGLEAGVTLAVAEQLSALLRRRDPLAEKVALSKAAYVRAFIGGVLGCGLSKPLRTP